jgi:ubiquinone/menaquinone biosynthesis C-methylase UbiE
MVDKQSWEKYYSIADPYGHGKWFSDIRRRQSSLDLIFKRNLRFEKCLELGCGEGEITKEVLRVCNQVTAVEISGNAIRRAKELNKDYLDRICFVEDDMYALKFREGEFDFINALESLDYTKERDEEISKWTRWLKPGGYILFSGPNLKGYFNYAELKNLFNEPELEVIEIEPVTTKFLTQPLLNRKILPQTDFLWSIGIFIARLLPTFFAKHVAILVRRK